MTLTSPGRPFTPATAREAARKSAQLRRERALERERYGRIIDEMVAEFGDRGKLGEAAFAATGKLIIAAVSGDIPTPETPLDRLRLAETARIAHAIARLEVGESTQNVAHGHVDVTVLQERLARLQIESQDEA